jgi:hypothetical protein
MIPGDRLKCLGFFGSPQSFACRIAHFRLPGEKLRETAAFGGCFNAGDFRLK